MNSPAVPSDVPSADEPSPSRSTPTDPVDRVDLDVIHRDLDGVEAALTRLDAGTYWSDEVTGEPLSDELLTADPTARRAAD